MTKTVEKYGLRLKETGEVLGFYYESNSGLDFCGETTCNLSISDDKMWLVDDKYQAEYVRNYSTEWYNAGYETPTNPFESEELEVVKVKVVTDVEPETASVPTMEEYLRLRYAEDNPEHLKYALKEIEEKKYNKFFYSWYDLQGLMEKKKWG